MDIASTVGDLVVATCNFVTSWHYYLQPSVRVRAMAERKKRKRGPNLSVGRGEKLPVSKGAGLTAKGRAKYNRETGSKLKPPVTGKPKTKEEAARKRSFCARSRSWTGERGKAARRRWGC